MCKWSKPHPFTKESISTSATEESGVYEISVPPNEAPSYPKGPNFPVVYIGKSDNIRIRLMVHIRGEGNKDIHENFEKGVELTFRECVTDREEEMEADLLQEFILVHGDLPDFNRREEQT